MLAVPFRGDGLLEDAGQGRRLIHGGGSDRQAALAARLDLRASGSESAALVGPHWTTGSPNGAHRRRPC